MRGFSAHVHQLQVTGSQVGDLLCLYSAAHDYAELVRVVVADADLTITTGLELDMVVKFLGKTVTAGTGGAAATVDQVDNGDTAASTTARSGDFTTHATTTGTERDLFPSACEIRQGLDFTLPEPMPFLDGEAVALSMVTAPNATVKLNIWMYFRERGTKT